MLELATADNSAPASAASRSTRVGVARGGSASALRGRHDPLAAPRRVRKFGRHRFAGNSCSWSTVAKRGLGPACRVDGAVAACTDRRCQRGPPRRASEGSCNSRAPRAVRCAGRCSPSARALGSGLLALPKYVTRRPFEAVQRTGPLRRLARGEGHPGSQLRQGIVRGASLPWGEEQAAYKRRVSRPLRSLRQAGWSGCRGSRRRGRTRP